MSDSGAPQIPERDSSSEPEPAAPETVVVCPGCLKRFSSRNHFCPKCGRSREEFKAIVAEKRLLADVSKHSRGAYNEIYKLSVFYAALLVLNFLSAYVLPMREAWGFLLADCVLIGLSITWMLSNRNLLKNKMGSGIRFYLVPLVPLVGVATLAITIMNNRIFIWVLGLSDMEKIRGTESFLASPLPLYVMILSVGVVPGIFEELFFRGLVQGTLEGIMSKREAWIVQAIIFAIAHVNPMGFFTYLVFMGLVLGWLRNRGGALLPGMIVHFTHNLLALLLERHVL